MSEKEIGAFPPIPEKRFFTIGEAAELVGVATSVLRFWEDEFKQLSPGRHGSRRRYEKKDILTAREIRSLLCGQGYPLAGAKKHLKHRKTAVAQATEGRAAVSPNVVEELRNIRDSIKNFLL